VEKVWADVSKSNKQLNWNAEPGIDAMLSSAWARKKTGKEISIK